jgi:diguanylate cyclase (GGDEF)-like protein
VILGFDLCLDEISSLKISTTYRLIFGHVSFPQSEEYDEFRYKFLIVLMLSAAFFTALFVAGEYSKLNRIQTPHMVSMQLFTAAALLCWLTLRGRPQWFRVVAWTYEVVCLMEYTSSLWLVPADELRLMWFFVNIPGVFILLGASAGWLITALTIAWLMISNTLMPVPYSSNAMATATLSMVYLGVFFHAFGARSFSYFIRMRECNRQLEQLASHDTLTGVLNARAYYAACDQNLELARRTGQPYAVLFVDLDHFKSVNDTYGHAAGDAVLKAVASYLGQGIRKSDALGRIGGEEFSIFMPNTQRSGALGLAESLRAGVEGLQTSIGDQNLKITASIGVACSATASDQMSTIQKKADQAMYVAKSLGRNRVSLFDELPDQTRIA